MIPDPLARYGTLSPPEERRRLIVRESGLAAFRAAYACWLDWVQRNPLLSIDSRADRERLYEQAVEELKGRAEALNSMAKGEAERMLAELRPEQTEATGLFVSAWLNHTALTELDGVFEHQVLGYRLAAAPRPPRTFRPPCLSQ